MNSFFYLVKIIAVESLNYICSTIIVECIENIAVLISYFCQIPTHGMPRFVIFTFTHIPKVCCIFNGVPFVPELVTVSIGVTDDKPSYCLPLISIISIIVWVLGKQWRDKVGFQIVVKDHFQVFIALHSPASRRVKIEFT